jgi:hypothetical protein
MKRGQAGRPKNQNLTREATAAEISKPHTTMAPRPHVFATLSLPPDFFTSFSSLELISSTRQGTTAIYGTTRLLQARAPPRHHSGAAPQDTTATPAPQDTTATWLLKAPRRCGSSKVRAPPWRGLLHDAGRRRCGSSRHHGGAARRRCNFSRHHGSVASQAARAPPGSAGAGSTKAAATRSDDSGLGSVLRSFLFLKINVWCQLTTPKFKLLVQPSSIILDFLYLINRSADTRNRLPTDKKRFFVVVILC